MSQTTVQHGYVTLQRRNNTLILLKKTLNAEAQKRGFATTVLFCLVWPIVCGGFWLMLANNKLYRLLWNWLKAIWVLHLSRDCHFGHKLYEQWKDLV